MTVLGAHNPRRVASRQNARIKELRAGLTRGLHAPHVAVEGLHLVQEAARSGLTLHTVFLRDGDESLLAQVPAAPAEVLIVDRETFHSVAQTEHSQGIAALVDPPSFAMSDLFRPVPLIVVAVALQDPGNLGALIRSAEAFGATGIILLPGTVSMWNSKALRSSAGSAFRLPAFSLTAEQALAACRAHNVRLFATVARQGSPDPDFRGPAALLVGNEGAGLPASWVAQADAQVTIPLRGSVESLNATVAASVLLYEAMRQRSQ
jgi:RNA methyltransferase, TrmH family